MERWFATWLRTKRKHAHAVATARSMIARMPKVRLFWALGEWKFQTMIDVQVISIYLSIHLSIYLSIVTTPPFVVLSLLSSFSFVSFYCSAS
jgi:hypothetical protein